MFDAAHIYGFDIETLNDERQGLDPTHPNSRITQIALETADRAYVFENDSEFAILDDFVGVLLDLPSGLLAGWNSSIFDLAFIHTRAEVVNARWVNRLLRLIPQPDLKPKYAFTPGHNTGYMAQFVSKDAKTIHSHLDIAYAYKSFADSFGLDETGKPVVKWSLKPVAKAAGVEMYEIDRTRLHEYTLEEQRRYVMSDAHGTRELTLKMLGLK